MRSDKTLNRLEDLRQDDTAMRNVLAVICVLAYIGLTYIACVMAGMVTFTLTTFNFFTVIWNGISHAGLARNLFILISVIFVLAEIFLFLVFKGFNSFAGEKPGYELADNANYGSSRFASSKEYGKQLSITDSIVETDGIVLGTVPKGDFNAGRVVSIPKNHPHNRNIFICGSQGTSKSIAFSRTAVMQCILRGESVFLTDPKGELYKDLALYLKMCGYDCYQWNLVNRWSSDGWDILQEVNGDEPMEYIDILVDSIMANTRGADGKEDFFEKIETDLLKALCLYVLAEYAESQQNFAEVYNLLVNSTTEELDAKFAALPDDKGHGTKAMARRMARGAYNMFSKSPNNKGNAVLGLGSRLAIFATDVVQKMTSTPDIELEGLAKKKTAIFCIASDTTQTYAVLNALLTSMTFIKVMAYADRIGGKCPVPVQFILDEFVNIGSLPDFTKKLATARSRDIGMTVIVQNIPQLQNRFPHGQAEEIIGGCDFRILLGANDDETSKYFSAMTGMTTIKVNTDRKDVTTSVFSIGSPSQTVSGSSEGSSQRAVILPDEIRRMNPDELLLFIRGEQPIKLTKFKYFYDPCALFLRACRAADVIPNWAVEDGLFLRTGRPVTETRAQMENRLMHDPNAFVVQDSAKWGAQRTDLIQAFYRARKKYEKQECFPNGVKISLFDDFILGNVVKEDIAKEKPIAEEKLEVQAEAIAPKAPDEDSDYFKETDDLPGAASDLPEPDEQEECTNEPELPDELPEPDEEDEFSADEENWDDNDLEDFF